MNSGWLKFLHYGFLFTAYILAGNLKANDEESYNDFIDDSLLNPYFLQIDTQKQSRSKEDEVFWTEEEWGLDQSQSVDIWSEVEEILDIPKAASATLPSARQSELLEQNYDFAREQIAATLEVDGSLSQINRAPILSSERRDIFSQLTIPAVPNPKDWAVRISNLPPAPYYKDKAISSFMISVIPPESLNTIAISNFTLKALPIKNAVERGQNYLGEELKIRDFGQGQFFIENAIFHTVSSNVSVFGLQFLIQFTDQENTIHEFLTLPFKVLTARLHRSPFKNLPLNQLKASSPVSHIAGIGPLATQRLHTHGINYVADLIKFDPNDSRVQVYLCKILSNDKKRSKFNCEWVRQLLYDLRMACPAAS